MARSSQIEKPGSTNANELTPLQAQLLAIAPDLADAYRRSVTTYRREIANDLEAAHHHATTIADPAREAEILLEAPVEEVTWNDLQLNTEQQPDLVALAWDRLRATADLHLQSGHAAARLLETGGTPLERAEFLAIRDALLAQWPPTGPGDLVLVDLLAQQWTLYGRSLRQAIVGQQGEILVEERGKSHGTPRDLHATGLKLTDRALDKAERYHRMFLRTLKMLVEGRRQVPSLFVASAGQINVGQQQVNVANENREV